MNVASIGSLTDLSKYGIDKTSSTSEDKTSAFKDLLNAAVNQMNETSSYTKAAQEAETSYALGESESPVNLMVAQQKANLSLQYTVAIRNNVMDAYKEIMNIQF